MPYDITDAKEDIQRLDINQQYLIKVLQEKKIIEKPEEEKKEEKE